MMARLMVWGKSAGRWMGGARDREDEKRVGGAGGEGRDVGDEAGFQESERTASLNP